MNPFKLADIHITQGGAFNDIITLYQDEAETIPADLSGITFTSELRSLPNISGWLLATFRLTVLDPPASGRIQRHLSAAETALIPIGGGWYDIKAMPPNSDPEIWCNGRGVVGSGITA